MAKRTGKQEEVSIQLATKIPRTLHRAVKMHCIKVDTSLMAFIVTALGEKLARDGKKAA